MLPLLMLGCGVGLEDFQARGLRLEVPAYDSAIRLYLTPPIDVEVCQAISPRVEARVGDRVLELASPGGLITMPLEDPRCEAAIWDWMGSIEPTDDDVEVRITDGDAAIAFTVPGLYDPRVWTAIDVPATLTPPRTVLVRSARVEPLLEVRAELQGTSGTLYPDIEEVAPGEYEVDVYIAEPGPASLVIYGSPDYAALDCGVPDCAIAVEVPPTAFPIEITQ